jgi:hypothetical protein
MECFKHEELIPGISVSGVLPDETVTAEAFWCIAIPPGKRNFFPVMTGNVFQLSHRNRLGHLMVTAGFSVL